MLQLAIHPDDKGFLAATIGAGCLSEGWTSVQFRIFTDGCGDLSRNQAVFCTVLGMPVGFPPLASVRLCDDLSH